MSLTGGAGGQRVDFTVGSDARGAHKLDLMLVIDTTGSMGDEIRYLHAVVLHALAGEATGQPARP